MIRPTTPDDAASVSALAVAAGMFPADDTTVTDHMMADYFASNHQKGHRCLLDVGEQGEPLAVAYYAP